MANKVELTIYKEDVLINVLSGIIVGLVIFAGLYILLKDRGFEFERYSSQQYKWLIILLIVWILTLLFIANKHRFLMSLSITDNQVLELHINKGQNSFTVKDYELCWSSSFEIGMDGRSWNKSNVGDVRHSLWLYLKGNKMEEVLIQQKTIISKELQMSIKRSVNIERTSKKLKKRETMYFTKISLYELYTQLNQGMKE